MPVAWSVATQASQGFNTVNLPSPGTLVGVYHQARHIDIQIDPSHLAVVPGRPTTLVIKTTKRPYVPVVWPISATSITFQSSDNSLVVFYFGTPDPDAVPLSDLVAAAATVTLQNTGSAAAVISSTANFNFLTRAKLTGVLFDVIDNNANSPFQLSFTAMPGYSLVFAADYMLGLALSYDAIIPLADIPVAQSLQVAVSANIPANSQSTVNIIFYYRVD